MTSRTPLEGVLAEDGMPLHTGCYAYFISWGRLARELSLSKMRDRLSPLCCCVRLPPASNKENGSQHSLDDEQGIATKETPEPGMRFGNISDARDLRRLFLTSD